MDKYILTQLLFGPLMLVAGIIFRTFPPKSINIIYGYRTPYAMKSLEVWDEANKFSFNLMIGVGLIVTIVQIILHFTSSGASKNGIIVVIVLVVLLISVMY